MFKLLVGLGNPGREYEMTRHNVGFMLIDFLAKNSPATKFHKKFHSDFMQATLGNDNVMLAKPLTYVNCAGKAVQAIMQFYKLRLSEILVIHDDLDLNCGRIKMKVGGNSGGHNGLKSIDQMVGNQYTRLRIGISRPPLNTGSSEYVLSPFLSSELDSINKLIDEISTMAPLLLSGDYEKFINVFYASRNKN